jgi:DNA repair protein RadC
LAAQTLVKWRCPQCGYTEPSNDHLPSDAFFRPWHVIHGRAGVKAYVASLSDESHEWLLALFVDANLRLLAVDTVARGSVDQCRIPYWKLMNRGHLLDARGFILVHNHPSGDPRPSPSDIRATVRVARIASDLEMPLLDHLIVAGDELISVGYF